MAIKAPGATCAIIAAAALLAGLSTDAIAAEDSREVTLRMKGGGFQVTGEIRAFDGAKYVVETTQFGRLTLQAARFDCIGPACTAPVAHSALEQLTPERHEQIAIRGSDAVGEQLMGQLIRGFASSGGHSVVRVVGSDPRTQRLRLLDQRGREVAAFDLTRDGATAAIGAVEKGEAAIAMTDRAALKEEVDELVAAGPKIRTAQNEHVIGTDGIAIIVAPDNPVSSLSLDVIARIFSGQLTDWYELGQPPARIRILLRDASSEISDRLAQGVLKPRGLKLAADAERLSSDAELADTVARDRAAIGIASLAVHRSAKVVPIETPCGLVQRPTPFAVKAGEYPLSRRLYLYSIAPPKQAAARGLLRYAQSPEAQAIISESQIAGQSVESIAFADQSDRMAHALNAQGEAFDLGQMRLLLADLKGARRLSSTLRHIPGTPDLDGPSKAEIGRLANLLMTPEYAGKKVLLLGFSDANGTKFQTNLAATYKRSGQVKVALLAASGQKLDHRQLIAKGHGPLAPIACNDTAEGQRQNRRVEVWIKD